MTCWLQRRRAHNREHDSTGDSCQEWYDDDNEDYDEYELKAVITEEHDALQKAQVFTTRANQHDYSPQQQIDIIQKMG
eukprot:4100143-Amphidinium_carterae.1